MAWTSPMTATAGSAFTAADFNTFVRDNLNETAVAKATTAGRIFVSTGLNSLAERAIGVDTVGTLAATISTSFTNLTPPGPSVTVTTGTSAMVFYSAFMWNDAATRRAYMSPDITGASTVAASDSTALMVTSTGATPNEPVRASGAYLFSNLTAGSNTFNMLYRADVGTANFQYRQMFVIPL